MARYVFAADRLPNWQVAERMVGTLGDDELLRAVAIYGIDDLGAVRASMFSGLVRLRAEWDRHFFFDGGVISADSMELECLALVLADLGIAPMVGLTVNARTPSPVVSDPRTPVGASRRTPSRPRRSHPSQHRAADR
jgi:hypothetical protein